MAKSSLQKAIEKQQKEAKRMAENEARRQRASQVVSGQPIEVKRRSIFCV